MHRPAKGGDEQAALTEERKHLTSGGPASAGASSGRPTAESAAPYANTAGPVAKSANRRLAR